MQRPTCTDIRIRSVADAQVIFYAVSQHILPVVARRLDGEERRCIRSGSVYVWEERGPDAEQLLGIERWTDGIRWGPSRVRDEFLFYNENKSDVDLEIMGHPYQQMIPVPFYGRPRERLVKQTYSVFVETSRGRRKWHLIAYFTQETIDNLYTIEDFPDLACLRVPPGLFRRARSVKGRAARDMARVVDHHRSTSPSPRRHSSYAPYPCTPQAVQSVQYLSDISPPPSPMDPPPWPGHRRRARPSSEGPSESRFTTNPDGTQNLAPLAFLETNPPPKRHPIDDRVLRSFSLTGSLT
ncbi:hypothetical protein EVG20_g3263 [Dentipellis fragilis]|uniref:Gti1/Pac2 family-domain-containing protein n=1 Tax=Dentipellis fragilis TaxID=205917 RepID=A0A4Y9Z6Z9_9AGAM|nr:hypothetical protein EVG20_g3263 [Dentipellis fragilis]